MSDNTTHINYSLADIERYLKGGMDAKEMHEIEKAALQDPFLADAIEGYSEVSFDKAHLHLSEITAALQAEKKDAKLISITAKKIYSPWKAAAIIILIAGMGTIGWYVLQNNNSGKEIALNNEKAAQQKNPVASAPQQNSAAEKINSDSAAGNNAQQKKVEKRNEGATTTTTSGLASSKTKNDNDKVLTYRDDDKDVAQADIARNIPAGSDKAELSKSYQAPAPASESFSDSIAFKLNTNAFTGKIVDKNNRPLSSANIILKNSPHPVKTDSAGNFTLLANDSTATVTISSPGYKTIDTVLTDNNMNLVALADAPSWLSQIPVTNMESKRKAVTNNANTNATETFPQGGWVSFQDYVYQKLHKERDTLNSPVVISGNVELEFSVNADGIPYDFKVLKSLDDESDAKAIAIIKDGPRWIAAKKNKKGKVTIRF